MKVTLITTNCPHCEGGGMIAKLYSSGHHEVKCDKCNGSGQIELWKDEKSGITKENHLDFERLTFQEQLEMI